MSVEVREIMAHMGDLVKEKRMEKHWSIARLADKSGVDKAAIYKIESKGTGYIGSYVRLFRAMGYNLEPVPMEMWKFCK